MEIQVFKGLRRLAPGRFILLSQPAKRSPQKSSFSDHGYQTPDQHPIPANTAIFSTMSGTPDSSRATPVSSFPVPGRANSVASSSQSGIAKRRLDSISTASPIRPTSGTESTPDYPPRNKRAKTETSGRDLSHITILPAPSTPTTSLAQPTQATPGLLGNWFRGRKVWEVTKNIELNDEGQVYVLLRDHSANAIDDKTPVLRIRCSRTTISGIAKGYNWTSMFQGKAKGSEIHMPEEDDVEALLFILRTAHRNTDDIPEELSMEQVVKIATICHKYSAVGKIRDAVIPRIPKLYAFEKLSIGKETTWRDELNMIQIDIDVAKRDFLLKPGNEEWLFVAWTFGFKNSFAELLSHVVRTCKLTATAERQLLNAKGQPFRGRFPLVVIDHIKKTRERYLNNILTLTYEYARELLLPEKYFANARGAELKHAWELCGKFYIELRSLGLLPTQPKVEDVHQISIQNLEQHLRNDEGSRVLRRFTNDATYGGKQDGDGNVTKHDGNHMGGFMSMSFGDESDGEEYNGEESNGEKSDEEKSDEEEFDEEESDEVESDGVESDREESDGEESHSEESDEEMAEDSPQDKESLLIQIQEAEDKKDGASVSRREVENAAASNLSEQVLWDLHLSRAMAGIDDVPAEFAAYLEEQASK
ncbi:hypothetical protein K505DRAFT_387399 [Melanomma pulvis-pyrius CBS 109.77]|uniref:Uncharacterized protein n=1 Tax=Melanomma pulvis-pyrius CBS 109.77 TaxID=1314802 RepID=A0A6A6X844_9PLEO|nr:hypothetical protein K505DRAFT_387399 [Melanomma pulvis-pyrius CBS 109.77]